jgi:hypothetical protein
MRGLTFDVSVGRQPVGLAGAVDSMKGLARIVADSSEYNFEPLADNGCVGGELAAETLALAPEERRVSPLPVGKRTVTFTFRGREVCIYLGERHDLDIPGLDDAHRFTGKQCDYAEVTGLWDGLVLGLIGPDECCGRALLTCQNECCKFVCARCVVIEVECLIEAIGGVAIEGGGVGAPEGLY